MLKYGHTGRGRGWYHNRVVRSSGIGVMVDWKGAHELNKLGVNFAGISETEWSRQALTLKGRQYSIVDVPFLKNHLWN